MIGLIRADDLDRWASGITAAPEFPDLKPVSGFEFI